MVEDAIKSDKKNLRLAAISAFASQQRRKIDPFPFCSNALDFINIGSLSSYVDNLKSFCGKVISEAETDSLRWEPLNKATKEVIRHPARFLIGKQA